SYMWYVLFVLPASDPFPTRRSSDLPRRAVVACVVLGVATTFAIAAQQGFDVPTLIQAAPQMGIAIAFSVLLGLWFAATMRRSEEDRKSTRLNSSHVKISYAVFCLKK